MSLNSYPNIEKDFNTQIKRGHVPGWAILEKFGRNPSISINNDPQDVWNGGGIYTGFPTGSSETVDVFSGDPEDGAGSSTGLLTLRLFGQLAGVEQTEDIILNGTTVVTSILSWDRIYSIRGLSAGSVGSNIGEITARHSTTTTNVFTVVPIGTNRTQIAGITIPSGKRAYICNADFSITRSNGSLGSATMAIMIREPGSVWEQTYTTDLSTSSVSNILINRDLELPSLTDVIIRVVSVTDNSTGATGHINGYLVDDGY